MNIFPKRLVNSSVVSTFLGLKTNSGDGLSSGGSRSHQSLDTTSDEVADFIQMSGWGGENDRSAMIASNPLNAVGHMLNCYSSIVQSDRKTSHFPQMEFLSLQNSFLPMKTTTTIIQPPKRQSEITVISHRGSLHSCGSDLMEASQVSLSTQAPAEISGMLTLH